MQRKTSKWVLRRVILGFAVAAIAAPVAQARIATDEGVFSTSQSTAVHETDGRASLVQPRQTILPASHKTDGRLSLVRPTPQYGVPRALPSDYARAGHPIQATPVKSQPAIDERTFDWGDAGIGAAFAFGAILLLGGATLATRHLRRGGLAGA